MANSASYNQIRKPSINTGFFKDRHKDMMLALARMMMVPCPIKTDTNAQIKSFLGIYGRNDATWKLHAAYIGASATDYDSYWISAQIYRMKKMGYYVRSEPTTLENIQMVCQAVGSGLYGLALIVGGDIIIATTGYTGIGLGFGVYATTSGLSRVAGSFSDLNAIYDRNYENIGKGDILNNLAYGVGYHLNGKDGANFLTGVRNMTDGGIYLYSMNVATNQNMPSKPSPDSYEGRMLKYQQTGNKYDNPNWYEINKNPKYPTENNGATTAEVNMVLQPGTVIDRHGSTGGKFLAPKGTPFGMKSLPYAENEYDYHVYEVTRPLPVHYGTTKGWFGQPGGGEQYRIDQSVDSILNFYIKEVK